MDKSKCIFCRICDGLEKNEILYNDDDVTVFRDIKPCAKNHLLIVTKEHIKNPKELTSNHKYLVEKLIQIGKEVIEQLNENALDDVLMGFHWPPFNTISHLHLHVISPASEMSFLSRLMFKPNSWWFVTPEYVLSRL